MNIRDALCAGADQLSKCDADISVPHLEAQILLSAVVSKPKEYLIAYGEETLSQAQCEGYFESVCLRSQGMPMAYILGYKEFMNLSFFVDSSVLIPRDDTEILVRCMLEKAAFFSGEISVLNLGTGSGSIEVALAKNNPPMRIIGVDNAPAALAVAQKNISFHDVSHRITLHESDLFSCMAPDAAFDMICSNPPYISHEEMKQLPVDVARYEPQSALYGGIDGLDFYRRIAAEAQKYLRSEGMLFLEIGSSQSSAVMQLLNTHGWRNTETLCDLQGHIRVLVAQKPKETQHG